MQASAAASTISGGSPVSVARSKGLAYTGSASVGGGSPKRAGSTSAGSTLKKTFSGSLQPTMSRTASAVWKFAERPGPGSHRLPSLFGDVIDSRKSSARSVAISTGSREHGSFWVHTCTEGPKYSPLSSVGTQVTSKRENAASFGFGTSTRDGWAKAYTKSKD